MPVRPRVSIVIPARNEAAHIGDCLDSIAAAVGERLPYEVTVVDHGSTDGTAEIARSRGVRVVHHPRGTVADARNTGVALSAGEVLAFVDGDVVVSAGWGRGLERMLDRFRARPRTIAGATPGITDPPSWVERLWFDPAKRSAVNHLPGANMTIPRALFEELGGFDARLETGEDYDLCRRVTAAGGEVVKDDGLAVEHRGWPRTLRQFVRREAWHGAGDFASLRGVRGSRVAQATVGFVALHLAAAGAAVPAPGVAAVALAGVAGLCGAAALAKYRRSGPVEVVQLGMLYYAYFFGRSVALFRALGRAARLPAGRRAAPAPDALAG
ncbi:MAG TPA: glycosyltransferase [Longimicrobiaceae bacterium]|nr:glycosyltransferase [Longimicrobiaceae bacterium]